MAGPRGLTVVTLFLASLSVTEATKLRDYLAAHSKEHLDTSRGGQIQTFGNVSLDTLPGNLSVGASHTEGVTAPNQDTGDQPRYSGTDESHSVVNPESDPDFVPEVYVIDFQDEDMEPYAYLDTNLEATPSQIRDVPESSNTEGTYPEKISGNSRDGKEIHHNGHNHSRHHQKKRKHSGSTTSDRPESHPHDSSMAEEHIGRRPGSHKSSSSGHSSGVSHQNKSPPNSQSRKKAQTTHAASLHRFGRRDNPETEQAKPVSQRGLEIPLAIPLHRPSHGNSYHGYNYGSPYGNGYLGPGINQGIPAHRNPVYVGNHGDPRYSLPAFPNIPPNGNPYFGGSYGNVNSGGRRFESDSYLPFRSQNHGDVPNYHGNSGNTHSNFHYRNLDSDLGSGDYDFYHPDFFPIPPDVCTLPVAVGPCQEAIPRYYFDPTSRQCRRFTFGGCDGNGNNFETFEECRKQCGADVEPTPAPSGRDRNNILIKYICLC